MLLRAYGESSKTTLEDTAAFIVADIIKQEKNNLLTGMFMPGVYMLFNTGDAVVMDRVDKSEMIFSVERVNKRETIKKRAHAKLADVRALVSPTATLHCIVVIADAYIDEPDIPEGVEVLDYLKDSGYVRPPQQPKHKEVMLMLVSRRDKEIIYTYNYDRRDGRILFGKEESEVNPEHGFITKIFPKDI